MGVVYKAEDQRLGRPVALKLLSSNLMSDADARRRFVREAKAAAALDHPGICTVYEAGEVDVNCSSRWRCSKVRRCASGWRRGG